jgi:hypothetical protein
MDLQNALFYLPKNNNLCTNTSKPLKNRKIWYVLQKILINPCKEIVRLYTSMKEFRLAKNV